MPFKAFLQYLNRTKEDLQCCMQIKSALQQVCQNSMSLDSSVSITTMLSDGCKRNWGSHQGQVILIFSIISIQALGTTQTLKQCVLEAVSLGVKQ
jgi:ABC-type transport system involved in cytochrome bd biosynthesis fused ATPase/permease subunit